MNTIEPVIEKINSKFGACDAVVRSALDAQTDAYFDIISRSASVVAVAAAVMFVMYWTGKGVSQWLSRRRTSLRFEVIADITGENLSTVRRMYSASSADRAKFRIVSDRQHSDAWEEVEADQTRPGRATSTIERSVDKLTKD